MFTSLQIKNLALVSDLTLDLHPGFNVVTGETGAGKSVVIGAIQLLAGGRADRGLIRAGCDQCVVEGIFQPGPAQAEIEAFLKEQGIEATEDGSLLLKRLISSNGSNRQWINGGMVTLQSMSELGGLLVEIHGPSEHYDLVQSRRQLALLDGFAGLTKECSVFAGRVAEFDGLLSELDSLTGESGTNVKRFELLQFQVHEIESARIVEGEDATLEEEYNRVSQASKLLELSQTALGILNENEGSLITLAGTVGRALQELQRLDTVEGACLLALHSQALDGWKDLVSDLSRYAEGIDLNPERLNLLQERLDLLNSLKRKYGGNLSAVIEFAEKGRSDLNSFESRDSIIQQLNAQIQGLESELRERAEKLSKGRHKAIKTLAKAVELELEELGFRHAKFEVSLVRTVPKNNQWNVSGIDDVAFLFAPNFGEPLKPLKQIASSGELSRVMLGIKRVLAEVDATPVMVFDEVDSNVGGTTANAIGSKMRQIGFGHQVLCVTHLAPVASAAPYHFTVYKESAEGRTVTRIRPIDGIERIRELARMLGGESNEAIEHARTLLESSQKAQVTGLPKST